MANHSDEMRQYREAFSLFDKDHDDIIAPQELGNSNLVEVKKNIFFVLIY
jgi:Ca2+-binding EF-hand superfamily protein